MLQEPAERSFAKGLWTGGPVQWPALPQRVMRRYESRGSRELCSGNRRKTVVKAEPGGRQDEREVPQARSQAEKDPEERRTTQNAGERS